MGVLQAVLTAFDVPALDEVVDSEFRLEHRLCHPQQYGIAVSDVREACARAESLGAGPFVRAFVPSPGWTERGQQRPCKLEVALGYADDAQLEFLGPGQGTEFYSGVLGGRHAVLHHAGFYQNEMARLAGSLEGAGFPEVVRGGTSLGPALSFDFRYFDTRERLGVYCEVLDFRWLSRLRFDLEPLIRGYASVARRVAGFSR